MSGYVQAKADITSRLMGRLDFWLSPQAAGKPEYILAQIREVHAQYCAAVKRLGEDLETGADND